MGFSIRREGKKTGDVQDRKMKELVFLDFFDSPVGNIYI